MHTLVHGIPGGKNENEHASARLAQSGQYLPSVQNRQHYIKNDEVDIDLQGKVQTFQTVCGNVDDKARLAESLLEKPGSFYLVFDYQDLHSQPRATARTRRRISLLRRAPLVVMDKMHISPS